MGGRLLVASASSPLHAEGVLAGSKTKQRVHKPWFLRPVTVSEGSKGWVGLRHGAESTGATSRTHLTSCEFNYQ